MGWPEAIVKIVEALCALVGGAIVFCAFFGWPFAEEPTEEVEIDERTEYENWLVSHRCSVPQPPAPLGLDAHVFICPECSRYWIWVPALPGWCLKHKVVSGDYMSRV